MTIEQPGLFGDAPGPKRNEKINSSPPQPGPARTERIAFLPGVKAEDAYQDISDYQALLQMSLQCSGCRLRAGCQQVVFGCGDVKSKIMFIGEGPGKDEDLQGQPFVGRAGQLLDKILDAGGFHRPSVYICNVVKCRPPGNRLPNPDEVKECSKYLEAQIRIIRPQIIVCLGALASQVVIDPKARITQIRGRWFSRQGIQIIATFHPAALLRNESYKRPTWEDIKSIRKVYQSLTDGTI